MLALGLYLFWTGKGSRDGAADPPFRIGLLCQLHPLLICRPAYVDVAASPLNNAATDKPPKFFVSLQSRLPRGGLGGRHWAGRRPKWSVQHHLLLT